MYYPDLKEFTELTKRGNLVPVYKEILADMETPVGVLKKLCPQSNLFLLESVEGGEKWGRYSFLGFDPRAIIKVRSNEVIITDHDGARREKHQGDPLAVLRRYMKLFSPSSVAGLPRFYGGAVGFFSYEMVHYFERLPSLPKDEFDLEEAVFFLADTLIIFDRVRHTIKIVVCALCQEESAIKESYQDATAKIDRIISRLTKPVLPEVHDTNSEITLQPRMSREDFTSLVEKAKDHIVAGDIIQVVLSQRFQAKVETDPVDLYRALRFINPSPYLFFFKHEGLILIGSSPETMVRLEEGQIELRPIAGTKPRGKNEQEDQRLAAEMLGDPKERAEHVMLVDLGRNDLGRVSRIGSVQVNQLMTVERYSHVMHLVSNIQSQLAEHKDAFDVIRATFPAGTLSGAPKVRAMEIISELEKLPRGPYGGAIGYFGFSGNMDFGITIRTIIMKDHDLYIQAGAGIVADSIADNEYDETINKARGMIKALALAAKGFEITNT